MFTGLNGAFAIVNQLLHTDFPYTSDGEISQHQALLAMKTKAFYTGAVYFKIRGKYLRYVINSWRAKKFATKYYESMMHTSCPVIAEHAAYMLAACVEWMHLNENLFGDNDLLEHLTDEEKIARSFYYEAKAGAEKEGNELLLAWIYASLLIYPRLAHADVTCGEIEVDFMIRKLAVVIRPAPTTHNQMCESRILYHLLMARNRTEEAKKIIRNCKLDR